MSKSNPVKPQVESTHSASFCTKNHQNPFDSFGERVDWSLHANSKKMKIHPAFMSVLLIQRLLQQSCNKYTHEDLTYAQPFCQFFRISMQTSTNSFSKTTKLILMIFGAKWSWGLACLVAVFCLLLLFSGKDKNFTIRLELCFPACFFCIHAGMANCWFSKSGMAHPRYLCEILSDMERSDSGSKKIVKACIHQIWS